MCNVLPRFRHKTSTAEEARNARLKDRPSSCRRPLPIIISTKADLSITSSAGRATTKCADEGLNGSSILQAASAVGRLADRKLATELRAMRLGLTVLVPGGERCPLRSDERR